MKLNYLGDLAKFHAGCRAQLPALNIPGLAITGPSAPLLEKTVTTFFNVITTLNINQEYLKKSSDQVVLWAKTEKDSVESSEESKRIIQAISAFIADVPAQLECIGQKLLEFKSQQSAKVDEIQMTRINKQKEFLTDYYIIFSKLVEVEVYIDLVLRIATKTKANPNGQLTFQQNKNFPLFLHQSPQAVNLFDLENVGIVFKIDKVLYEVSPAFYNIEYLLEVFTLGYTYHPDFIEFIRVTSSAEIFQKFQAKNKQDFLLQALKYIYYLYTFHRISQEINQAMDLNAILQFLSGKITKYDYFDGKSTLRIASLISEDAFNRYQILMYQILKGKLKNVTEIDDDDIETFKKVKLEEQEALVDVIEVLSPSIRQKVKLHKVNKVINKISEVIDQPEKAYTEESVVSNAVVADGGLQAPGVRAVNATQKAYIKPIEEYVNDVVGKKHRLKSIIMEEIVDKYPNNKAKIIDELSLLIDQVEGKDLAAKTIFYRSIIKSLKDLLDKQQLAETDAEYIKIVEVLRVKLQDRIFQMTKIDERSGFFDYLEYTLRELQANRANGIHPFFANPNYQELRSYDLCTFYYFVLDRAFAARNQPANSANIQKRLLEIEGVDVNRIKTSIKYLESMANADVIVAYLKFFETYDKRPTGTLEANGAHRDIYIFNFVYKFLLDVRTAFPDLHSNIEFYSFKELCQCISENYNNIVSNKNILQFTKQGSSKCNLAFGELTKIYPAITLYVYQQNANIVSLHDDLHKQVVMINYSNIYRYLKRKVNDTTFFNYFDKFCNNRKQDYLCFGKDLYDILYKYLNDQSLQYEFNMSKVYDKIIEELKTSFILQAQKNERVLRFTLWDLISSFTRDLLAAGQANMLSMNLADIEYITIDGKRFPVNSLAGNEDLVTQMASFLALKFSGINFQTRNSDSIYAATQGLLAEPGIIQTLVANPDINIFNAKFFVQFADNLDTIKEVVRLLDRSKGLKLVFSWRNNLSNFQNNLFSFKAGSADEFQMAIKNYLLQTSKDTKAFLEKVEKKSQKVAAETNSFYQRGGTENRRVQKNITQTTITKKMIVKKRRGTDDAEVVGNLGQNISYEEEQNSKSSNDEEDSLVNQMVMDKFKENEEQQN